MQKGGRKGSENQNTEKSSHKQAPPALLKHSFVVTVMSTPSSTPSYFLIFRPFPLYWLPNLASHIRLLYTTLQSKQRPYRTRWFDTSYTISARGAQVVRWNKTRTRKTNKPSTNDVMMKTRSRSIDFQIIATAKRKIKDNPV